MNAGRHLSHLTVIGLLLAVCASARAQPVPIIVPGMPMPDGNGEVSRVRARSQLPDGRLIVGVDITRAFSPITGLPMMTNYGAYNYSFATGQMVRELRHDYPTDQGGTPDNVGVYRGDIGVPLVLDNGDRMYQGDDESLYRYVDGNGLICHGVDFSPYCSVGPNGHIGAHSFPGRVHTLSRNGTASVAYYGLWLPNIERRIRSGSSLCIGADGSQAVSVREQYTDNAHIVRIMAGAAYDTYYPLTYYYLFPVRATAFGDTAMAFQHEGNVLIQSAMYQPLRTVLAYGQSIRGDRRVHGGMEPFAAIHQGFREGGFAMGAVIRDSVSDTELGDGVYVFDTGGTLVGSVLPGDANPFGPGTVAYAGFGQITVGGAEAQFRYQNPTAITGYVQLVDTGSVADRAFWRIGLDGSLALEIAEGQTVPGTNKTVEWASLLAHTADGRSVYRFSYLAPGSTNSAYGLGCYTPGQGLRFDVDGRLPSDYDLAVGPNGARLYDLGTKIWFVEDGMQAVQIVPGSVEIGGRQCDVTDARQYGMTLGERPVVRLELRDLSTAEQFAAYYMYSDGELIELIDWSQLFDGRPITSGAPEHIANSESHWICTAPGDLPVFQVNFADGTSGLYAVPEPGTALVLAIGALVLLRRRHMGSKKPLGA